MKRSLIRAPSGMLAMSRVNWLDKFSLFDRVGFNRKICSSTTFGSTAESHRQRRSKVARGLYGCVVSYCVKISLFQPPKKTGRRDFNLVSFFYGGPQ